MKYCAKCGNQMVDEAVVCVNCGCAVEPIAGISKKTSGLTLAAKILMIIATVVSGFVLLPLAWTVPMTVIYFKKLERGEPISLGFKICVLLFVSTPAGILMLCDGMI